MKEKLIAFLRWLLWLLEEKAMPAIQARPADTGSDGVLETASNEKTTDTLTPKIDNTDPEKTTASAMAFSKGERFLEEGIQRKTMHASLGPWGCYFFALYRLAQELNHSLGQDDYLYWYDICVAAGHVIDDPAQNKRAFIQNAAGVLNVLVGARMFSVVRHVPSVPESMNMFPVRVQNGNSPHFVLQNMLGDIWDSLGGGSYTTVNYREII